MEALIHILVFFIGASVGSFLIVVADWLPLKKSLIYPPSSCPSCEHKLAVLDLIPIFSYIWLSGQCKYCKATIPIRILIVELASGLLFILMYVNYGLSWDFLRVVLYCFLFIVLIVIDMEHKIIPNKLIYPAAIITIVISIFFKPGIISSLIGGGVGFIILLIPALIYKGGMGGGDIKLATLVGLMTGFPVILITIFVMAISGGIVAITLLLMGLKKRKDAIPLGPFLCLAGMIALFWGSDIIRWYFSLL